jgi:uncharacterized membrane protein (DUF2068 family)
VRLAEHAAIARFLTALAARELESARRAPGGHVLIVPVGPDLQRCFPVARENEHDPAGVRREPPSRFRPRFHWELLHCGVAGHALVGLDARTLRPQDAIVAREVNGVRWHRCLRCDSWLSVHPPPPPAREHPPDRDEIELPLRGKALRDKIVLRLIAINRALHFAVLGLLGTIILIFSANREQLRAKFYKVTADLTGGAVSGEGHAKTGLLHELDKLFTTTSSNLHLLGAVFLAYAAVEGIEAVGLWLTKRWAEYLTFIVTASLLPFEIYELTNKLSALKVVAFVINVAVVVYLLFAKRLFGINGGRAAEEALIDRDMGWEALERTTPPSGP